MQKYTNVLQKQTNSLFLLEAAHNGYIYKWRHIILQSLSENLHRTFQSIGHASGVRNGGECGIALTTT